MIRTRLYHHKRRHCSIAMQCCIRQHLARKLLNLLRFLHHEMLRCKACTKIQNQIRMRGARKVLKHLIREAAAVRIQCLMRSFAAKLLRLLKRKMRNILRVFRWYQLRKEVRCRKAAYKIVSAARLWCFRRLRHRRIVFHSIALWFRKSLRRRKSIQRY